MTSKTLYLLDTNILVHYARRSSLQQAIEARYGLTVTETLPLFSYVSEAELLSLAARNKWGREKSGQLDYLLSLFQRVPVENPAILRAYVQIDEYSRSRHPSIAMGKNDLWITATARATAATLLTTDKDFDHLDGPFLDLEWIDPDR